MRAFVYCFLILVLFLSCQENEDRIYPTTSPIAEMVYSSVTIQPDSLYNAFAVVNGILDLNLVEEGQVVEKGEPIAQIINSSPALSSENAKMSLELARENFTGKAAVLESLEKELDAARLKYADDSINYERQKNLWERQIGSKSTLEAKKLAFELSASSLELLKDKYNRTRKELSTQLQQAENNYEASLINTEDFTVRSKINGKVYALHKKAGEIVTTAQPVATVGSSDKFVIEMLVDEVDIVKVKKGQAVILTLDAYKSQVFEAVVDKIYPKKDERSQTFVVEAIFENQPEVLYPGLSGEANIITAQKEKGLVIPRRFLTGANKVKTENGLVEVKLGIQTIDSVEILEGISAETAIYPPEE